MSDLFKSAFEYFSSSNNGQIENNFIGQIVQIGNAQIRAKNVIAEGIFLFLLINLLIFIVKS